MNNYRGPSRASLKPTLNLSCPSSLPYAIWKRWWFWVAVVVVVLIAASAGSSEIGPTEGEAASPSLAKSAVPDVEGQGIDTATTELLAQAYEVRVKEKLTDAASDGTVLRQSPAAGSGAPAGHPVVLLVTRPLPLVPNVVGDKIERARSAVKDAGFRVKVKQRESSKPEGIVIAQSPKSSTSTNPHRSVTLIVAKAPTDVSPTPTDCQGYSPCIPPGPDVDCSGGDGDGPRYVSGPVQVTGADPYGLDGDNNGVGCE
jgi:hypothetical protein